MWVATPPCIASSSSTMEAPCPQVPGQGGKLEGTIPPPCNTLLAPTVMSLADEVDEQRRGEYAEWRAWARDKDNLSTGSSITSEPRQDPNSPGRAQPTPSHHVAKLIADCGPVFHTLGFSIQPTLLKEYADYVANFVDNKTQLRRAEEWGREQLNSDAYGPEALTLLAAEDCKRVERFGSLVSLAEAAYDRRACMSIGAVRCWQPGPTSSIHPGDPARSWSTTIQ